MAGDPMRAGLESIRERLNRITFSTFEHQMTYGQNTHIGSWFGLCSCRCFSVMFGTEAEVRKTGEWHEEHGNDKPMPIHPDERDAILAALNG